MATIKESRDIMVTCFKNFLDPEIHLLTHFSSIMTFACSESLIPLMRVLGIGAYSRERTQGKQLFTIPEDNISWFGLVSLPYRAPVG